MEFGECIEYCVVFLTDYCSSEVSKSRFLISKALQQGIELPFRKPFAC